MIKYFAVKVLLACADMIRVGPLRRIDRALLGHSLHSSGRAKSSEAVHELTEMLRQCTSPSEEAILKAELAQARVLALLIYFVPRHRDPK